MTYFATKQPKINNSVYVKSPNQLANGLNPNTAYIIDQKNMDLRDVAPIVMNTDLGDEDFIIKGEGLGASWLGTTSDNTPLFANKDGSTAGTLYIEDINLYSSGAGGSIFALDKVSGTGAIQIVNVNFLNSDSLGYLANYRQSFISRFALIGVKDGLEHIGSWGGMVYTDGIVVPFGARFPGDSGGGFIPFDGTLFKAGTGLTYTGSFRTNVNALSISDAGSVCDFAPANVVNDAEFICDTVRVNAAANAFPNMPASSVKALFRDCVGCENTYVGGIMNIDTEVTTTFTATNTPEEMEGVGVYDQMTWFQPSGDNGFQYISAQPTSVQVSGPLAFSGSNNNQVGLIIRHYDDSEAQWKDVGPVFASTMNGGATGTRAENMSFSVFIDLEQNDLIQAYIQNGTNASSITANIGAQILVERRS